MVLLDSISNEEVNYPFQFSYDDALEEMKRITNISDYKSYLYDEEKINHNEFKTNYYWLFR